MEFLLYSSSLKRILLSYIPLLWEACASYFRPVRLGNALSGFYAAQFVFKVIGLSLPSRVLGCGL